MILRKNNMTFQGKAQRLFNSQALASNNGASNSIPRTPAPPLPARNPRVSWVLVTPKKGLLKTYLENLGGHAGTERVRVVGTLNFQYPKNWRLHADSHGAPRSCGELVRVLQRDHMDHMVPRMSAKAFGFELQIYRQSRPWLPDRPPTPHRPPPTGRAAIPPIHAPKSRITSSRPRYARWRIPSLELRVEG